MYLDSCILLKLLVVEPDSALFDEVVRGQPLSSSELAWTEIMSALLAKERARSLSAADRKRAWQRFAGWIEEDEIRLEPLDSIVLRKAAKLHEYCQPNIPLRTLDAIHEYHQQNTCRNQQRIGSIV